MSCVVDGCRSPVKIKARGLCNLHYIRLRRSDAFEPLVKVDRFPLMYKQVGDCWEWQGAMGKGNYGRWNAQSAHRVSWERVNGPIPEGMTIDHLCRNHPCVNPEHLRLLTPHENFSDNFYRDRTECINGHAWSTENTRLRHLPGGYVVRCCRACARIRSAAYAARRKQKSPATHEG